MRRVILAAVAAVAVGTGCRQDAPTDRTDPMMDTQASDSARTGAAGTTGTQPMTGTGPIGTDAGAGVGEAMSLGADGGTMMRMDAGTPMMRGADGGTAMPDAGR